MPPKRKAAAAAAKGPAAKKGKSDTTAASTASKKGGKKVVAKKSQAAIAAADEPAPVEPLSTAKQFADALKKASSDKRRTAKVDQYCTRLSSGQVSLQFVIVLCVFIVLSYTSLSMHKSLQYTLFYPAIGH